MQSPGWKASTVTRIGCVGRDPRDRKWFWSRHVGEVHSKRIGCRTSPSPPLHGTPPLLRAESGNLHSSFPTRHELKCLIMWVVWRWCFDGTDDEDDDDNDDVEHDVKDDPIVARRRLEKHNIMSSITGATAGITANKANQSLG